MMVVGGEENGEKGKRVLDGGLNELMATPQGRKEVCVG